MLSLVLCVLLLTTCAQGKTVQQLGDDPSCGTPVECYAQAIEALKEAEQKIAGLNIAVSNLNQSLISSVARLNQTIKDVVANQSNLKPYPCNCTDDTEINCRPPKVSQGFANFCGSQCTGYLAPVIKQMTGDNKHTGNYCCDLCVGTAEEAKAYALAHPLPEPAVKECDKTEISKDLL